MIVFHHYPEVTYYSFYLIYILLFQSLDYQEQYLSNDLLIRVFHDLESVIIRRTIEVYTSELVILLKKLLLLTNNNYYTHRTK